MYAAVKQISPILLSEGYLHALMLQCVGGLQADLVSTRVRLNNAGGKPGKLMCIVEEFIMGLRSQVSRKSTAPTYYRNDLSISLGTALNHPERPVRQPDSKNRS